ncbi:hypothetical protein F5051DRAFT_391233, partial [Lentinula edodes]
MHLNIKWGKERTSFTLEDPSLPISVLKNHISQWSHLPPESIKLIHSGAVLKNDNAPYFVQTLPYKLSGQQKPSQSRPRGLHRNRNRL